MWHVRSRNSAGMGAGRQGTHASPIVRERYCPYYLYDLICSIRSIEEQKSKNNMCPPWKFDRTGYKQQEPYAYPFDKPEAQQHFKVYTRSSFEDGSESLDLNGFYV